jgi:mRNA interferase RelE/StbE
MTKYRTVFHPEARDELRKLSKATAMAILRKLTELETDPLGYGTTALVGATDVRRLRVGDYRIVYTIDQGHLTIWVVHVRHRSIVYNRKS